MILQEKGRDHWKWNFHPCICHGMIQEILLVSPSFYVPQTYGRINKNEFSAIDRILYSFSYFNHPSRYTFKFKIHISEKWVHFIFRLIKCHVVFTYERIYLSIYRFGGAKVLWTVHYGLVYSVALVRAKSFSLEQINEAVFCLV